MRYSARSIIWLGLVFWSMTPPEAPRNGADPLANGAPAKGVAETLAGASQVALAAGFENYCRQNPGACLRMIRQAAQLATASEPRADAAGQGAGADTGRASVGTIATALKLAGYGQNTLTAQDRTPDWRGPALPAISIP